MREDLAEVAFGLPFTFLLLGEGLSCFGNNAPVAEKIKPLPHFLITKAERVYNLKIALHNGGEESSIT